MADFVGQANLFSVKPTPAENHQSRVEILGKSMTIPVSHNEELTMAMIRPENIVLGHKEIRGHVLLREDLGLITRYHIGVGQERVKVDVLGKVESTPSEIDQEVFFDFNPSAVHLIRA